MDKTSFSEKEFWTTLASLKTDMGTVKSAQLETLKEVKQTSERIKNLELENARRQGEIKAVQAQVSEQIKAGQRRESNYTAPIVTSLISTGIGAAGTVLVTFFLLNS